MRTTLTLDDDVAAMLERLRKRKGATFKQLVNDALRTGLRQLAAPLAKSGYGRYLLDIMEFGR